MNPYPSADFSLAVTVDLKYPLKNGQCTLNGWLIDGLGDIGYYFDSKWKSVPWNSVTKVVFMHARVDDGLNKSPFIPTFVYRLQGKYSNVWREYSLRTMESRDSD